MKIGLGMKQITSRVCSKHYVLLGNRTKCSHQTRYKNELTHLVIITAAYLSHTHRKQISVSSEHDCHNRPSVGTAVCHSCHCRDYHYLRHLYQNKVNIASLALRMHDHNARLDQSG